MITLSDVARAFGIGVTQQSAMRRLRKLESETGLVILLTRGDGKARRYFVNPEALAAAMGCNGRPPVVTVAEAPEEVPEEPAASLDINETANQIASAIDSMNDRIEQFSVRLFETQRQLREVQARLQKMRA
jgi:predicted transcriptional regulator